MTRQTLRIGTRGSALALAQAHWVRDRLACFSPDRIVEIITMKTQGDRIFDRPLAELPGKGFFVKEIQKALVDGEVDLAVHSLKDLPVEANPGLVLGAVPARESPADVLVTDDGRPLEGLAEGAIVGTSSARRRQQLAHHRRDLAFVEIRGNVDTRLSKLARGDCQALVLARAGLVRLGLSDVNAADLPFEIMLPAVGQGALGLEVRESDTETLELVGRLEDPKTRVEVLAERGFLAALGGGCSAPIGAHAQADGERLILEGVVCEPRGSRLLRSRVEGSARTAESLAARLAQQLIERGADRFLD